MERVMIIDFNSKMSEQVSDRYNYNILVFEAMLEGRPLDRVMIAVDRVLVSATKYKAKLRIPFEVLIRPTMISKGLIAVDRFIMIPQEQDIVPN